MLGKCFCDGLTVWGLLAVPRLLVCHGGHVLYLFMTLVTFPPLAEFPSSAQAFAFTVRQLPVRGPPIGFPPTASRASALLVRRPFAVGLPSVSLVPCFSGFPYFAGLPLAPFGVVYRQTARMGRPLSLHP
jgi:hypothetical protein